MANKQHARFSDENGNIYYLENQTEDVLDPSGKPLSDGGDLSEASVTFTADSTRTLPKSGSRFKAFCGSVLKFLSDLKTVSFSGSYNDLSNKPSIPSGAAASQAVANNCTTTAAGSVLDARQGKVLMDKTNQLSSDLANGQIEFDLQGGKGVYRQKGADAWLPFSNTLVLMDGTASAAFSGINVTRYSTFVLNNFDYSNYSKIRITNLGPYGYQVTCGTQLITADGTYDVSSLASDKLQVLYRGDTVNPNIMLRIELIP
ncbi:hypothetical protein [Eisenbergiella porci]|uniref:hypothetical protein n=1 Tax=Eisenbergiella porci TaxID=2652274 RepID=UPI002A80C023|nr:hypothetical protein [Eisenbergiella porci]